ncbi:hypothetical protein HW555_000455, partial [Spodoptera exigua]
RHLDYEEDYFASCFLSQGQQYGVNDDILSQAISFMHFSFSFTFALRPNCHQSGEQMCLDNQWNFVTQTLVSVHTERLNSIMFIKCNCTSKPVHFVLFSNNADVALTMLCVALYLAITNNMSQTMEDLLATQKQIMAAMNQLLSNFKKDGQERKTPDYIKRRLETLDSYWQEFQSNNDQLTPFSNKSIDYFALNHYQQTHAFYLSTRETIKAAGPPSILRPATPLAGTSRAGVDGTLKNRNTEESESTTFLATSKFKSQGTNSRLDDLLKKQSINFKAFHRTVTNINVDDITEKWEFQDTLKTLETRWSAIDMLHWELEGELDGQDDSYEDKFTSYERTYNNMKKSLNSKLWSVSHREQSTPKMEVPTFNVYYVKRIHDTTIECVNAIKNMGADVSTWDPIICYLMSNKLDANTHSEYIASLKQPRELPILSEFLDFLEAKFTSMESSRRKECISTKRCQECDASHNTLLHDAFAQAANTTPNQAKSKATNFRTLPEQNQQLGTHVAQQREVPETLLSTAVIRVQKYDGSFLIMRALIDQGSQTSLITENAAQQLGLPRQRCKGVITGIGARNNACKGIININCSSRNDSYFFNTDVFIMKSLTKNLPTYTFAKPTWSYLENIELADPDFYVSRPIDILFGADIYSNIIMAGICRLDQTTPIAQQTRLGWILCGNVNTLQCNVVQLDMEQLQKFWETEEIA